MDSTNHAFFAPCPRGLEAVLADELTDLGAADVKAVLEVQHGRVPRGVVNRTVLESNLWKERLAGLGKRFGS